MKFYAAIQGDLILTKRPAPTAPTFPIVARSVPHVDAAIIRFVLWLAALFAPIIAPLPPLWSENKARLAVLAIVGVAIIEVAAQAHIEQALGVIA